MSVEEQCRVKREACNAANIRVSPLPPAVSPNSGSLPAEELPGSNSPVLATMTPVSVDDFPAEYQHHEVHDESQLMNAKQQQQQQVIYVSAPGTHQTILYDPQNPEALGQQISIQETINTSNGPVSVVVPSSLASNGTCQGAGPTTVLVYQEYVEDVTSALPLK